MAREEDLALTPVFNVETAQNRLAELQKFVKQYLHEGEDYGTIPGTPKPTLLKPGADKLCDIYGLADRYRVTNRVDNWETNLFDYEIECELISKRTGNLVSTGLGSCNSYEEKYRWRNRKAKCPECGKETVIKGKKAFGGGWLCWNKPGKSDGCGFKWKDGDQAIEGQEVGRIENENIADQKNTLLKMAKKRAKVDAVLAATRSSGIFTQDVEEWQPVETYEEGSQAAADEVAARKIAEHEKRTRPAANAANGTPGAGIDAQKVIFIVGFPEKQDGDVEITGPLSALEAIGAKRKVPNAPEGHENHRLLRYEFLTKLYDTCRDKGIIVKDLTEKKSA